jgi:hypothetical protein
VAELAHDHVPGCRAVWFDETGAYRGDRAFDAERCPTCAAEQSTTNSTEGATP